MNITKKICSIGCILFLIVSLTSTGRVYASNESTSAEYSLVPEDSIQWTMEHASLPSTTDNDIITQELYISGATVMEDSITVYGTYEDIPLIISGKLRKSTNNPNAVVVEVTNNSILDVLYLEITTSNTGKAMFKNMNNIPIVKLYALTPDNDMIIWEENLENTTLSSLALNRANYENAEGINDILWITQIMEPTDSYTIESAEVMNLIESGQITSDYRIEQSIRNELAVARASNDYFWAGDVHSISFSYGSDTCLIQFCPYFEGNIVDVPYNSGSANWTSGLKVSESVLVNGQLKEDLSNVFSIKNIKTKMAAGVNTKFTAAIIDGTYNKNGSTSINISGMLGMIIDSIPGVNKVYDWITNTISYIGSEVERGSSLNLSNNTRAFQYSFSSDIELTDSTHYINVNSWVSSMGDSAYSDADGICGISWEFQVYRDDVDLIRTYNAREYVDYCIN